MFLKNGVCSNINLFNIDFSQIVEFVEESEIEIDLDIESDVRSEAQAQEVSPVEKSRFPNSYQAVFLLNYLYRFLQTNLYNIETREVIEIAI